MFYLLIKSAISALLGIAMIPVIVLTILNFTFTDRVCMDRAEDRQMVYYDAWIVCTLGGISNTMVELAK